MSKNEIAKVEEIEEPKTYINLFCCHLSLNIICKTKNINILIENATGKLSILKYFFG